MSCQTIANMVYPIAVEMKSVLVDESALKQKMVRQIVTIVNYYYERLVSAGLSSLSNSHYFLCFIAAHYFMTPCKQKHDEKVTTFLLSIIVFTNGRQLEDYFFEEGNPYAKKITHHIFDVTKMTILNILKKASIDYRRDQFFVEQSDWV